MTTSEIAKALCNMDVSTQCSFSTIVLVQYAEKSFPQMKTIEKKNAMVQLAMTKSMDSVTQVNIGAVVLVKTRRYRRTKLAFTRPSAGTCKISTGQNAYWSKNMLIVRNYDSGAVLYSRLAFPLLYLGLALDIPAA